MYTTKFYSKNDQQKLISLIQMHKFVMNINKSNIFNVQRAMKHTIFKSI